MVSKGVINVSNLFLFFDKCWRVWKNIENSKESMIITIKKFDTISLHKTLKY
jgi:hypothetical protein